MLDRTETHSRLIAFDLESHVRGARGDIAGFRSAAALNGLIRARAAGGIDPVDGLSEKTWHDRQVERLLAELEAKPAYSQFRIIGVEDGGRELIRVDRSGPNGAVRLVPDAELQQKGERPYFKETIGLPVGEIYVSALDLNQEHGAVERPFTTLRIATPQGRPDGKLFESSSTSTDRPLASGRRHSRRRSTSSAQGDYFVHPDRTREFASDLGQSADWRKDFPDLAPLVGSTGSIARTITDPAGRQDGVALGSAILAGGEWVGIIEVVPNAIIIGPAVQVRNTALTVGVIAVLFAAVLALLIARSLTRPIVQLTTAVESIARGGTAAIPVEATGETGVLARAFARMIAESTEKTVALEREVAEHRRTEAARDHHAERERLFVRRSSSSNDAIIDVARRHGHRLEYSRRAALRLLCGRSRGETSISPPPSGSSSAGRLRRTGRKDRAHRNDPSAQRRPSRSVAQHLADQGAVGRPSAFPRLHAITETNRTWLAPGNRPGAAPHLRRRRPDPGHNRGHLVQSGLSCRPSWGMVGEMTAAAGKTTFIPTISRTRRECELRGAATHRISDTRVFTKTPHGAVRARNMVRP